MPDPNIIVTFYCNCRQEPVDVSGIFSGGFDDGEELRTYEVHEVISEAVPTGDPEHPFEFIVIEEKDYDEVRKAVFSYLKDIHIVASSGTWKFKVHINGENPESSPIAYNGNAADINAAIPALYQDPGKIKMERRQVKGGGAPEVEFSPEAWIQAEEFEPGHSRLKFFTFGGFKREGGISFLGIDLGLGPVFELQWFHDENQYFVPIERGLLGGGKAKQGEVVQQGGAGGSRASPRPVSGSRA